MDFSSDNTTGAAPEIMDALARANAGQAHPYGTDAWTRAMQEQIDIVFERKTLSLGVLTGTAANSIALASFARPGGVVLCHPEAHINADECGAPGFLSDGLRLAPVAGPLGKITPEGIEAELAERFVRGVHAGQPVAVSITNLNEFGQGYTPEEVHAIAETAHAHGLKLHMDGARFANIVAHLGCTPADLTWKAGVDVLTLGGSKNGCWAAEAVVFFDPADAADAEFLRKRSGHLLSKGRFIGAQMAEYLAADLWLRLARNANAAAARLADGLAENGHARLIAPPMGNEVFAIWERGRGERMRNAGVQFHTWPDAELAPGQRPGDNEELVRLVTAFNTTFDDVDRFLTAAA